MNARVRHGFFLTTAILVVILLAGATYQGVSTALERRKYPRPGGLIEVGDHQLHLYCMGSGSPAVILEAAAGAFSGVWGWVQPEIAKTTRVCSYDRAGLGWSERGDRPYDPDRVPDELHALLGAADVAPPYVVAGHALGASFARMFAARFPGETVGLVLVDPVTEMPVESPMLPLSPWLARTGVLRATGLLANAAEGLPEPSSGAVSAFLNRPDHLTRAAREIKRWNDAVQLGSASVVPATVREVTVETADASELDQEYLTVRSPLLNDQARARRVAVETARLVEELRRK